MQYIQWHCIWSHSVLYSSTFVDMLYTDYTYASEPEKHNTIMINAFNARKLTAYAFFTSREFAKRNVWNEIIGHPTNPGSQCPFRPYVWYIFYVHIKDYILRNNSVVWTLQSIRFATTICFYNIFFLQYLEFDFFCICEYRPYSGQCIIGTYKCTCIVRSRALLCSEFFAHNNNKARIISHV